jgi:hypothetical protein
MSGSENIGSCVNERRGTVTELNGNKRVKRNE